MNTYCLGRLKRAIASRQSASSSLARASPDDIGDNDLAPFTVGSPDDGSLAHARVLEQDLLDAGERPPGGGKPCGPARMRALGSILFRQRGDGHGAFALAVNLRKPRPETVERAQGILDIHGRAARNDGADVLRIAVATCVN